MRNFSSKAFSYYYYDSVYDYQGLFCCETVSSLKRTDQ